MYHKWSFLICWNIHILLASQAQHGVLFGVYHVHHTEDNRRVTL